MCITLPFDPSKAKFFTKLNEGVLCNQKKAQIIKKIVPMSDE